MARLRDQMALDFLAGSPATIYNNPNVGTTPLLMGTAASTIGTTVRRCQITNKHTTNYGAFLLTTTASPSFVASAAGTVGATEGINVPPATSYFLNFHGAQNLWICASAGSTPMQVVFYDSVMT